MELLLTCFLSIILQTACTQDSYNDLTGNWILTESNGEIIYECPDELVLKNDKTYEILNECYGDDLIKPIIEKGIWNYNKENNCIIFSNRILLSSYIFQNKDSELVIFIHKFGKTEVLLSYLEKEASVREKYHKR